MGRRLAVVAAALGMALAGLGSPMAARAATAQRSDLPSGNTEYRTIADYEADMAELVDEHPNLVKPITLPNKTSSGRTVHGIEISRNVHAKDGKPVFVTVGMHHGNEWPSGELTMEYAVDVVENASRPEFASLLAKARLVVVPVVNVDGFIANKRQTATKVDMNRNYGFGWLPISTGGAAPWSEPETRNIQWLLSTRQATTFVTQHTCIQVVLYPPIQLKAGPTQDVARFQDLGTRMAESYGPSYRALDSAHDYETTGEAIDWAYFATRGLAFTNETCPDEGVERTYETQVADAYEGHRGAMLKAFKSTADPAQHSVISGKAPQGAVLRIAKDFPMYTQPYEQPDGTVRPTEFPTSLTSELEVTDPSGRFSWSVNPSERPIPPYQKDGLKGNQTGFYTEPWTLTCERPDGTVLQNVPVNVGLGKTAEVDLQACARNFQQ
ncbi:M14 family zinc carboxypeptidase [Streptomyces sp. NPDC001292]|uniref:M14 family zinc carboxypeptidase n=1 Tax=Streptomyces sp. NPDC001292 TaxID=3364558 RepID=UPI003698B7C4